MRNAKNLSCISTTSLAVTTVVGSGVFGVAGLAIEMGGTLTSVIAWLVTALAVTPYLFIFLSLKKRLGCSGNVLQQVAQALGSWSELGLNLLLLGTYTLVIPAIALMGGLHAINFLNVEGTWLPFLAASILLAGIGVNLLGSQWVTTLSRLASFFLLGFVIFFDFYHLKFATIGWNAIWNAGAATGLPSFSDIWPVSLLLFYAFLGWESLSFRREDLKNPNKNLPFIYANSFLWVAVIYGGMALVITGASASGLNVSGVSGILVLISKLPLGSAFIVAVLLVIVANISAWLYSATRMLYSASQRHIFSSGFTNLNKWETPYLGLAYVSTLCALVLFVTLKNTLDLKVLIGLVNQNFILIYLLCLLTYWKMEKNWIRWPVSFAALTTSAFLISGFSWQFVYPLSLFSIGLIIPRQQSETTPHAGKVFHRISR